LFSSLVGHSTILLTVALNRVEAPLHYTMGGVWQCGDLLITVALENIEAKEGHCSVLLLVLNPLLRPRGSCEGPFTPTRAGIG
jgi:hypothetical protein